MKIVAGLGSVDEYISYIEAGADELFCGYVPEKWALKYGMLSPLNRREVLYYNVQIGSESELRILGKMMERYQVPVSITFNSLFYMPEQYPEVCGIMRDCMELGFHSFIVADPALLLYVSRHCREEIKAGSCKLHMSGETAEVNHRMIEEMRNFHIGRVIFHRKNTPEDMKACIAHERNRFPTEPLEYEAFALNEMCHFTGAFCNSLHCDELTHICRLPYRLGEYGNTDCTTDERRNTDGNADENTDTRKKEVRDIGEWEETEEIPQQETDEKEGYLTGRTGCGLCALWQMKTAGITHLKLVSRGNYVDDTMEDIRQLRRALDILEKSETEQEYRTAMRKQLFHGDCSHSCYYR